MNEQLKQAHKDLTDHIEFEESNVLPLLESRLNKDEIEQLNRLYLEFRTKAPWKPTESETPKQIADRLRTSTKQ